MLTRPSSCAGCALNDKARGWAPAVGPVHAPILLVGEALGFVEAQKGEPFVGPSGNLLDRILHRVGLSRAQVRIDNCIRCQPPNDWLVGAPWEEQALAHCDQYIRETLAEPHKVAVAVGASAARRLLNQPRKGWKLDNWHGTVNVGAPPIVPTFHPAFLLRGKQKLMGVVAFDLNVAKEVAAGTYQREDAELRVDPPVEWFQAWCDDYLAAVGRDPERTWLAVDIETPEKLRGEDEGELKDPSFEIVRINFAVHPGEGITVPWAGPYIELARAILASPGPKCFWNARYDVPRLLAAGMVVGQPILDWMWGWHVLQSDLPRGLGFVAPFYSRYGAWKHLSASDPGTYAAIDSVQTIRVAHGIARDLQQQGQWDAFYRHVYRMDTLVLHPAEAIGLPVDRNRLEKFGEQLQAKENTLVESIRLLVPESVCDTKQWVRKPDDPTALPVMQQELTQCCTSCGAVDVAKTHRCQDKKLKPSVTLQDALVERWVARLPFNPASPTQVLRYMQHRGHKGGRGGTKRKTSTPSTDKNTLQALAKSTKDPFYKLVLDQRAVGKVLGTYVEGSLKRLGEDGRLHPHFLHVPSTMRLSCVNPNLQNVVADKTAGEEEPIAAGFRNCVVASPGCSFVAIDFAAIEAVQTGWFIGDPDFIRLATLGIHAYCASHELGKPASLSWSHEHLEGYFRELKKAEPLAYKRNKQGVYLTLYGGTAHMLHALYPTSFPTLPSATKWQSFFLELCPKVGTWQDEVRRRASKQGYLGGSDHPFGYRHWFWNVYDFNSRTKNWHLGEDAKRSVAFYPQSTAYGVLAESALEITDPEEETFIGDFYFGQTPIRALIHDEVFSEVPDQLIETYIPRVTAAMKRPIEQQPCPESWGIGSHLSIGVSVKVGKEWGHMQEIETASGVASDSAIHLEELEVEA